MIQFDIVQLSRKEYAIVGRGTYYKPIYETLYDSKGGSHLVEVERMMENFNTTIDDCDSTISILDDNIIGEDYSKFMLHYPSHRCRMFTHMPQHFISTNLKVGINSSVLKRQFFYRLFWDDKCFLKEELKLKGLDVSDEVCGVLSDLKSFITGKEDKVRLYNFTIKIKALFEHWWTPQIRSLLKQSEYYYPKIYDIDNGLAAVSKLFKIRTELKKKAIITYEY